MAFVEDTLGWAHQGAWDVLVAHRGPADGLRAAVPGVSLITQVDGGLGERITGAVAHAFAQGAPRVVLVGTDSPTLPRTLLAATFAQLAVADATVVPAIDGGWVALGITRPLDDALGNVTWSSATTCVETIEALHRNGRRVACLPAWYDVDEVADLRRLADDLDGPLGHRAPRTAALLRAPSAVVAALGRIAA
jgi:uncharacterized protein